MDGASLILSYTAHISMMEASTSFIMPLKHPPLSETESILDILFSIDVQINRRTSYTTNIWFPILERDAMHTA